MIQKHTLILYKLLSTPFKLSTPQHRNIRFITHDAKPFLNNIILQDTNPLPFEKKAHCIHTIPLIQKDIESYLCYVLYKTFDTIRSYSVLITIQDVFVTYVNKLIEYNENLEHPKYRPSY